MKYVAQIPVIVYYFFIREFIEFSCLNWERRNVNWNLLSCGNYCLINNLDPIHVNRIYTKIKKQHYLKKICTLN